jgi:hypothetical protein
MLVEMRFRADTLTNWTAANPVIAAGEPVYETDTKRFRIGDGVSNFLDLPIQSSDPAALTEVSNAAIAAAAAAADAADRAETAAGATVPATETVIGVTRFATDAEIATGTAELIAIDPAGLEVRLAGFTPGGGAEPDASTTIKGIVELATNAETITGTDTVRAVTPAGVAAVIAGLSIGVNATETTAGRVELATIAEVLAGADTSRAVTPAGVAGAIGAIPTSTTAARGLVELATEAETTTGTDTTRAVTPAGVAAVVGPVSTAATNAVNTANAASSAVGNKVDTSAVTEAATGSKIPVRKSTGQLTATAPTGLDPTEVVNQGHLDATMEGISFEYSETLETKVGGSVFFRRCAAGVWPTRGTARSELLCIWISTATTDPAPAESGVGALSTDLWAKKF